MASVMPTLPIPGMPQALFGAGGKDQDAQDQEEEPPPDPVAAEPIQGIQIPRRGAGGPKEEKKEAPLSSPRDTKKQSWVASPRTDRSYRMASPRSDRSGSAKSGSPHGTPHRSPRDHTGENKTQDRTLDDIFANSHVVRKSDLGQNAANEQDDGTKTRKGLKSQNLGGARERQVKKTRFREVAEDETPKCEPGDRVWIHYVMAIKDDLSEAQQDKKLLMIPKQTSGNISTDSSYRRHREVKVVVSSRRSEAKEDQDDALSKSIVIDGLDVGMRNMKLGHRFRLDVNAPVAYPGTLDQNVFSNKDLVFEVEILGVETWHRDVTADPMFYFEAAHKHADKLKFEVPRSKTTASMHSSSMSTTTGLGLAGGTPDSWKCMTCFRDSAEHTDMRQYRCQKRGCQFVQCGDCKDRLPDKVFLQKDLSFENVQNVFEDVNFTWDQAMHSKIDEMQTFPIKFIPWLGMVAIDNPDTSLTPPQGDIDTQYWYIPTRILQRMPRQNQLARRKGTATVNAGMDSMGMDMDDIERTAHLKANQSATNLSKAALKQGPTGATSKPKEANTSNEPEGMPPAPAAQAQPRKKGWFG